MIALLPYGALGLMRGPAVRELIGGSLFFGSLASGSPGTPVLTPVGDQGQVSPGDIWGLQSAEFLGKLSVFLLKKSLDAKSIVCAALPTCFMEF